MAFIIDTINGSGLYAQSAASASVATHDSNGNVITATYLTGVDLTPYQTTAGMTAYATTGDVANKLDTTAFSDVSGTFLTAVDLSNYYTKSETSGATELADAFSNIPAGDAEVNSYVQTNSGAIDETVSTYETNSGTYLTAHQAISANEWNSTYDTVQSNSGSWGGGGTIESYNLSAGNYINITKDDVNSAIGIEVTGASVPTGTMNISGLEYNAVNEISGYNGSAIAQYGAEKQWLQHDDTIVHVANSAQYAFGVNVSAIAQLLGVDETVLFSGTGATGAFSEPLSAFKKVEFHLSDDTIIRQVAILYPDEAVNGNYIVGAASVWQPNISPVRVLSVSGNMNEFTKTNASYQWWSKTDGGYSTFSTTPVKVVGIGRKA